MDDADLDRIQNGEFLLNPGYDKLNEQPVYISAEDVEITTDAIPGYEVAVKGTLTVALDITITNNLKMEGEAREFVNRIQNIRKEQNFELTDKIIVKMSGNEGLMPSINQYNSYICAEILADKLEFVTEMKEGIEIEVNNEFLNVNVIKKGA